jgi:tetratricopeptide (TPR) repeat protein
MEKPAATVVLHPAQARTEQVNRELSPDEPGATAIHPEGRQPLPCTESGSAHPAPAGTAGPSESGEDFLADLAERATHLERFRHERRRSLGEISTLRAENRWEDILALFHPVEEKAPDLDAVGLAHALRGEIAFALGHLGRYEEAIALYGVCAEAEPSNFYFHAGLAYTAYDSLYAAKTRKVMLHPAERKSRTELAHRHFSAAQALRPDAVTNFYRQGMLFKQIQGKPDKGLPLFETAVRNWRAYPEEKKQSHHQERKNYVKALYQLASCLLDGGQPRHALEHLEACIREDETSAHLSDVHKYFALGKVHFHLGSYDAARQALEVAAARGEPSEDDYVFELLARVHLARNDTGQAWDAVHRVPSSRRRPYFRWTEADVLAARGDQDKACRVLHDAAERDRRGSHKALIRLARLEFGRGRFEQSLVAALKACDFFLANYQNPYFDGLFWAVAAILRLGRLEEAASRLEELEKLKPDYPNLGKLREMLKARRHETSVDPRA